MYMYLYSTCTCIYMYFILRQVFCDFGESFVVSDPDGEQPLSVLVSSITRVSTQYALSVLFKF